MKLPNNDGPILLYPKEPKNVFVFRLTTLLSQDDAEYMHRKLLLQVMNGVVLLDDFVELVAVTGPCTDVKVKMINKEKTTK